MTNPINILLANKFFYLKGGAETVFFQEREMLLQQGFRVTDFSMQSAENYDSPFADYFVPHIDYYKQKRLAQKLHNALSFVHSPAAVKNLERLLVNEKPDIAHLHNIYHQLTPSIIPVLKRHGLKVILTLHDCKLICPNYLALTADNTICTRCEGKNFWHPFTSNCQNSRARGLILAAEALWHKWKKSYEGVDLFLAPSKFMADLTTKRIPAHKIRVVYNGMDTTAYTANSSDRGYVLFLGRISREKGITTLLRASRQTTNKMPLKIIGTGPLADELKDSFPEAEFLGFRSGEELKSLISNAAFVVVPSEWYENCSMVVLEAMAMGKTIIGSRMGGIPEQIDDGETGFLFEMGNVAELAEKMDLLASDSELRERMGAAARVKLEQKYSLAEQSRQLLAIYSELLAK